jgi:hypothetical protein
MRYSGPSIIVAIVAIVGYLGACGLAARGRLRPRVEVSLLAVLASLAFVFHTNVLRWHSEHGLVLEFPLPHVHEYFHYYLGAKYFTELGYSRLYEACAIADFEDDRERFRPDGHMRDLTTNRLDRTRAAALPGRERVVGAFTPERWQAFKRDVALLRDNTDAHYWHTSGPYVDHGYNGTPLVTAVVGGLANQPLVSSAAFLSVMRWMDVYLLVGLAVVVAGLSNGAAALTFLFFMFANPLNEYGIVGGSYLRYNYLLALALAILAFRTRWWVASGALLAFSGWLRIFPLLLYGVVALHDLRARDVAARLRGHARFHVAFAATSALLLAATSTIETREGTNPWRAFVSDMSTHAGSHALNRIGLASLFAFSPEKARSHASALVENRAFDWERETAVLLERRRPAYLAVAAAVLAAALWSLRRVPTRHLLVHWLLVVFAVQPLGHYYYAVLGLVPLAVGPDRRILAVLAAALLGFACIASPLIPQQALELRFALYSAWMLLFLLVALLVALRSFPQSTDPGSL